MKEKHYEKRRRHQTWIDAARDIGLVLRKYGLTLHVTVDTKALIEKYPFIAPKCECTEERPIGVHPKPIKGGGFQLRTFCHSCLVDSKASVAWDRLGRDAVIAIFANYFREVNHGS